jgi:hypothetical protein
MKEITFPTRINKIVTDLLEALEKPEQALSKPYRGKEPPKMKRGRQERKEFFYYKPVIDQDTRQVVGHLADISTGGFKLDTQKPFPLDRDFHLAISLTGEIADKPAMGFVARSKWCRVDPLDPYVYNVGFQLILIAPEDLEIFQRMMEKYGRERTLRNIDLRRSNKW